MPVCLLYLSDLGLISLHLNCCTSSGTWQKRSTCWLVLIIQMRKTSQIEGSQALDSLVPWSHLPSLDHLAAYGLVCKRKLSIFSSISPHFRCHFPYEAVSDPPGTSTACELSPTASLEHMSQGFTKLLARPQPSPDWESFEAGTTISPAFFSQALEYCRHLVNVE